MHWRVLSLTLKCINNPFTHAFGSSFWNNSSCNISTALHQFHVAGRADEISSRCSPHEGQPQVGSLLPQRQLSLCQWSKIKEMYMAAPSGACRAEEWSARWRGLISSGFQSDPLQHRSRSVSRPQAAALGMPKYSNTNASRKQVPGLRFPVDWWWTKESYLMPVLLCLWVQRGRADFSLLLYQPGGTDGSNSARSIDAFF